MPQLKRWQRHASTDRRARPSIQPIRSFNLGRMLPYNDDCVNTDVWGAHHLRPSWTSTRAVTLGTMGPSVPAEATAHNFPTPTPETTLSGKPRTRRWTTTAFSGLRFLLLQGFSDLSHSLLLLPAVASRSSARADSTLLEIQLRPGQRRSRPHKALTGYSDARLHTVIVSKRVIAILTLNPGAPKRAPGKLTGALWCRRWTARWKRPGRWKPRRGQSPLCKCWRRPGATHA